jgi:hypothetical protein
MPKATKPPVIVDFERKSALIKSAIGSDSAIAALLKPFKASTQPFKSCYGEVKFVGPMNLKRSRVNDAYYAKFFLPGANYTFLNALGLQLGVTWDEALRGLVEQHMASGDPFTGLSNFIPALS